MTPPRLAMIAAVARNRVIGARNALPWRLPGDMRHFKATTMGKPVLMGRKTFDSIGRPLPGRTMIAVTRDPAFAPEGVIVARGLEEALDEARRVAVRDGADEIMVAGGGELYHALLHRAARLYLTLVEAEPEGDTLFPAVDPLIWSEVERRTPAPSPGDAWPHAFVVYGRR